VPRAQDCLSTDISCLFAGLLEIDDNLKSDLCWEMWVLTRVILNFLVANVHVLSHLDGVFCPLHAQSLILMIKDRKQQGSCGLSVEIVVNLAGNSPPDLD
jgi:hypothetical protein